MEEFKNGAISEEALEGVAGGFKVSKELVKKTLIGAGVGILAVGGAMRVNDRIQKQKEDRAKYAARYNRKYMRQQNNINNIDVDYFNDDEFNDKNDVADLNEGEMPPLEFELDLSYLSFGLL